MKFCLIASNYGLPVLQSPLDTLNHILPVFQPYRMFPSSTVPPVGDKIYSHKAYQKPIPLHPFVTCQKRSFLYFISAVISFPRQQQKWLLSI